MTRNGLFGEKAQISHSSLERQKNEKKSGINTASFLVGICSMAKLKTDLNYLKYDYVKNL